MKLNQFAAAVLATSACFFGVAQAHDARPEAPSMHSMRPDGRHAERMSKELDALKAKLNLNAEQSAKWDAAAAKTKPGPERMVGMKNMHDKTLQALKQDNPDLRALMADVDKQHEAMQAQRKADRDAWLSVYESLNPAQQKQTREFILSKMERMGRRFGPGGGMPPQ